MNWKRYFLKVAKIVIAGGFFGFAIGKKDDFDFAVNLCLFAFSFFSIYALVKSYIEVKQDLREMKEDERKAYKFIYHIALKPLIIVFILALYFILREKYSVVEASLGTILFIGFLAAPLFALEWIADELGDDFSNFMKNDNSKFGWLSAVLLFVPVAAFAIAAILSKPKGVESQSEKQNSAQYLHSNSKN